MMASVHAVINVAAVSHNLQKVREYAPDAKIMAVIKANAYGHGALLIAHALQNADAFAVARVDEGIQLRKAGITKRIAVLGGFACVQELAQLIAYQLEPTVHNHAQLAILEANLEQKKLSVWLKLDTGMNRLGFKADELQVVYTRLTQCAVIKPPIRFITHLANADDTVDDMTSKQITLFNGTLNALTPPLTAHNERSIANSAGILAWQAALTDWVRSGLMLYGISPFANKIGADLGLRPVMSLHSHLIAVKPIKKGDTVGYSGSWLCEQDSLLGVVAIGYADGYPRYAKVGTPVLVNGQRVPLIGRVSMDMITVDLSTQPEAKVGDAAVLWGEDLPVEEIAACASTIPYTLVCSIAPRVRQIAAK